MTGLALGGLAGQGWAVAATTPVAILTYHQIAPALPRPAPYRSLSVHPRDFARQMRLLKRLGYQGLSMTALQPYLRGERRGRVVGITFDDGYANNLSHAAPVLQALGFGATCYAVSARLGQTNDWDLVKGVAQVPLMDVAGLRAWQAAGLEVGAHTRHHVHLSACTPTRAQAEIAGSRAELEDVLGVAVRHFCYPYGDFDAAHRTLVREAGFDTAVSTARGRCRAGADPWALPRVPVLRATTWVQLLLKLWTRYEDRHDAGPGRR